MVGSVRWSDLRYCCAAVLFLTSLTRGVPFGFTVKVLLCVLWNV